MQLIYRGQFLDYQPHLLVPYRSLYGVNWRYQTPGETYPQFRETTPYQVPRALNWRWQSLQ